MPAFSRVVFLGFQAAVLVATVGPSMAPLPVIAAPVPISHIADYASQPPARTNATLPQVQDFSTISQGKDGSVVDHTPSGPSMVRRQDLGGLGSTLEDILANLGVDANNPLLTAIQDLLEKVRQLPPLNDIAQDKGLQHYDQSVELETELKDLVNSLKNTLDNVYELVDTLLPALGPIVYVIKCIVIALLDALENFTDGSINDGVLTELQEMLGEILGQTNVLCGLVGLVCQ